MVLNTHVIVASAVAAPFLGNPVIAFVMGLVSHLVLDAMPHWDWPLHCVNPGKDGRANSVNWNVKDIGHDVVVTLIDLAVGVVIVLAAVLLFDISVPMPGLIAAMFGGVILDGLQFLYFFIKKEPLVSIHELHKAIHHRPVKKADSLTDFVMRRAWNQNILAIISLVLFLLVLS